MKRSGEYGMTVVELMIGLAISLLITLIVGSLYVNSKGIFNIENSVSRLQEHSRFGIDMLETDLRMAGFRGCRGFLSPPVNTLNSASYQYQYAQGLYGFHATGGGWAPTLDASISSLTPSPVAGTDVITVWVPDQPALALLAPMTTASDDPQVGANSVFNSGDIAIISDCNAATIFQVTAANPQATGVLTHGVTGTPGNASSDLQHVYGADASVYHMTARTYFIAASTLKAGTKSVWRYCVPSCDGAQQLEELAEGVENLQVSYGIDTDGDGAANAYVAADNVTTNNHWANVVSVKLQLLMATVQNNVAVSPQSYAFAGASITATDKRIRVPLTTVVALRNRTS